ncbi:MAG: DUF1540 domain-containing protein [Methanocella sp.]
MPKVRCSVDDCQFWSRDNRCAADEVEVRNDQELPNMEIGEIAGEATDDRTSAKTCCKTYKPEKRG